MEIAFMAAVIGSLIYIQFQLHEIKQNVKPKGGRRDAGTYKPCDKPDCILGNHGAPKIPHSDFPYHAPISIEHETGESAGRAEALH